MEYWLCHPVTQSPITQRPPAPLRQALRRELVVRNGPLRPVAKRGRERAILGDVPAIPARAGQLSAR